MTYRTYGHLLLLCFFILIGSCKQENKPTASLSGIKPVAFDLDQIRKRGKIVALTDYNSTNYFIYRGEPMGYQFDLLKELADHMNLQLEIIVENDIGNAFRLLQTGVCDVIALNLTVTREREKLVSFTIPHDQTRQVLVQRKPWNWRTLNPVAMNKLMIRNQIDLGGKTVYVQRNSAYHTRLHHLSEEIGDSIHIIEVPEEVEKLISLVAKGEIDYTVCDENVGRVNQTYYPIIDIETAISFPQNLAWAVRKNAPDLLAEINGWFSGFTSTPLYAIIYNKYFKNLKSADIVASDYYTLGSGKISPYDNILQQYSPIVNWDWRLLASLIYQESRFDPKVVSWAGAFGLMQLMPSTAKRYGVSYTSPPDKNIEAGIRFLKWLDDIFINKVPNRDERIKFVLASYNIGVGHILDAMKLAEKYGSNPQVWEGNVEQFLLKKAEPKYYRDPLVKYGYCRGEETYNFVREIMNRYDHYRNILAEN
jgi:membrane-bound lytic murein transglycosylase F